MHHVRRSTVWWLEGKVDRNLWLRGEFASEWQVAAFVSVL